MKFLIVDDVSVMRKMQANTLRKMGYSDILEATNGIQALNKVENNPDLDLIIMDWNMPLMNGITALKQLKNDPKSSHIPVIMVTAEAIKDKVFEAAKVGAVGYIIVPFTEKEFITKVQRVIQTINLTQMQ